MKMLTGSGDIQATQNGEHRPAEHKFLEGKSVVW